MIVPLFARGKGRGVLDFPFLLGQKFFDLGSFPLALSAKQILVRASFMFYNNNLTACAVRGYVGEVKLFIQHPFLCTLLVSDSTVL